MPARCDRGIGGVSSRCSGGGGITRTVARPTRSPSPDAVAVLISPIFGQVLGMMPWPGRPLCMACSAEVGRQLRHLAAQAEPLLRPGIPPLLARQSTLREQAVSGVHLGRRAAGFQGCSSACRRAGRCGGRRRRVGADSAPLARHWRTCWGCIRRRDRWEWVSSCAQR